MYCIKCGSKIEKKTRFCPNCGTENSKQDNNFVTQEQYLRQNNSGINSLSIIGFILGLIAVVLSSIFLSLSLNEHYQHDNYLGLLFVIGLLSGIFFLVGLILSIVGTAKKPNALGIIGIVFSVISLIIDISVVIYFFTIVIG